jgi:hypothetical protein
MIEGGASATVFENLARLFGGGGGGGGGFKNKKKNPRYLAKS